MRAISVVAGLSVGLGADLAVAGTLPSPVELSSLDGSNGFTLAGIDNGDESGVSVGSAGDFNGDGIDDLIIGAKQADPGGQVSAGEVYVVFGSSGGFPAVLDLSTLNGTNGLTIHGDSPIDEAGGRIATAGDVNGDNIDDIVIGAEGADPNGLSNAGITFVVFGSDAGFPATLDLGALNGSNGFAINGANILDESGGSVGSGDVNGDGFSDVIMGAKEVTANGFVDAGVTYVIFGTDQGFPAAINVTALNGSNGFAINGVAQGDESGSGVAAGDVNGDGIDDVITGAPGVSTGDPAPDNVGRTYVVYGSDQGFSATVNLSSLNGVNGFQIEGSDDGDESGANLAAGDVNGDNFADVIIGARGGDPNGQMDAGETYVVFGSGGEGPALTVQLGALDGTDGFVINGIAAGDDSGRVASVGDVNGDGIGDVLVGSPQASPGGRTSAGQAYIVYGRDTGFSASIDLASLDGTEGIQINGVDPGDTAGRAVGAAGDLNDDGVADIVVGAKFAAPGGTPNAGESYVVFGVGQTGTPCPGDTDGSGMVDVVDLLAVILAWDSADPDADINDDGIVDVLDLLAVILAWGDCP